MRKPEFVSQLRNARTISVSRLREVLSYDPETGVFRWKISRGTRRAGAEAGTTGGQGYRYIGIDGMTYRASRIAWAMHYGYWPGFLIDHANRDVSDDRIANLREATVSENLYNSVRIGASGYKGVMRQTENCWKAQLKVGGNTLIAYCPTAEMAARAYDRAALHHHGEFAVTNEKLGIIPPLGEGVIEVPELKPMHSGRGRSRDPWLSALTPEQRKRYENLRKLRSRGGAKYARRLIERELVEAA